MTEQMLKEVEQKRREQGTHFREPVWRGFHMELTYLLPEQPTARTLLVKGVAALEEWSEGKKTSEMPPAHVVVEGYMGCNQLKVAQAYARALTELGILRKNPKSFNIRWWSGIDSYIGDFENILAEKEDSGTEGLAFCFVEDLNKFVPQTESKIPNKGISWQQWLKDQLKSSDLIFFMGDALEERQEKKNAGAQYYLKEGTKLLANLIRLVEPSANFLARVLGERLRAAGVLVERGYMRHVIEILRKMPPEKRSQRINNIFDEMHGKFKNKNKAGWNSLGEVSADTGGTAGNAESNVNDRGGDPAPGTNPSAAGADETGNTADQTQSSNGSEENDGADEAAPQDENSEPADGTNDTPAGDPAPTGAATVNGGATSPRTVYKMWKQANPTVIREEVAPEKENKSVEIDQDLKQFFTGSDQLSSVKNAISRLHARLSPTQPGQSDGCVVPSGNLHFVIVGPHGSGRHMMAESIARILYHKKCADSPELVRMTTSDLRRSTKSEIRRICGCTSNRVVLVEYAHTFRESDLYSTDDNCLSKLVEHDSCSLIFLAKSNSIARQGKEKPKTLVAALRHKLLEVNGSEAKEQLTYIELPSVTRTGLKDMIVHKAGGAALKVSKPKKLDALLQQLPEPLVAIQNAHLAARLFRKACANQRERLFKAPFTGVSDDHYELSKSDFDAAFQQLGFDKTVHKVPVQGNDWLAHFLVLAKEHGLSRYSNAENLPTELITYIKEVREMKNRAFSKCMLVLSGPKHVGRHRTAQVLATLLRDTGVLQSNSVVSIPWTKSTTSEDLKMAAISANGGVVLITDGGTSPRYETMDHWIKDCNLALFFFCEKEESRLKLEKLDVINFEPLDETAFLDTFLRFCGGYPCAVADLHDDAKSSSDENADHIKITIEGIDSDQKKCSMTKGLLRNILSLFEQRTESNAGFVLELYSLITKKYEEKVRNNNLDVTIADMLDAWKDDVSTQEARQFLCRHVICALHQSVPKKVRDQLNDLVDGFSRWVPRVVTLAGPPSLSCMLVRSALQRILVIMDMGDDAVFSYLKNEVTLPDKTKTQPFQMCDGVVELKPNFPPLREYESEHCSVMSLNEKSLQERFKCDQKADDQDHQRMVTLDWVDDFLDISTGYRSIAERHKPTVDSILNYLNSPSTGHVKKRKRVVLVGENGAIARYLGCNNGFTDRSDDDSDKNCLKYHIQARSTIVLDYSPEELLSYALPQGYGVDLTKQDKQERKAAVDGLARLPHRDIDTLRYVVETARKLCECEAAKDAACPKCVVSVCKMLHKYIYTDRPHACLTACTDGGGDVVLPHQYFAKAMHEAGNTAGRDALWALSRAALVVMLWSRQSSTHLTRRSTTRRSTWHKWITGMYKKDEELDQSMVPWKRALSSEDSWNVFLGPGIEKTGESLKSAFKCLKNLTNGKWRVTKQEDDNCIVIATKPLETKTSTVIEAIRARCKELGIKIAGSNDEEKLAEALKDVGYKLEGVVKTAIWLHLKELSIFKLRDFPAVKDVKDAKEVDDKHRKDLRKLLDQQCEEWELRALQDSENWKTACDNFFALLKQQKKNKEAYFVTWFETTCDNRKRRIRTHQNTLTWDLMIRACKVISGKLAHDATNAVNPPLDLAVTEAAEQEEAKQQ